LRISYNYGQFWENFRKFSKFPWKFGEKIPKIRESFPKIVAIFNQSIIRSNTIDQSINRFQSNKSIPIKYNRSINQSIIFNQIQSISIKYNRSLNHFQSNTIDFNQFQLNEINYNEHTNKFHEIQSNTIEFIKEYPNTVKFDHVQWNLIK
jgi:hypothetical protein